MQETAQISTSNLTDLSDLFDERLGKRKDFSSQFFPEKFSKAVVALLLKSVIITNKWICYDQEAPTYIAMLAGEAEISDEVVLAHVDTLMDHVAAANSQYDMVQIVTKLFVNIPSVMVSAEHIKYLVYGSILCANVITSAQIHSDQLREVLALLNPEKFSMPELAKVDGNPTEATPASECAIR